MSPVTPFVRHMLLCDDVRRSPTDPRKVIVYGLLSEVRTMGAEPAYPVQHSFSVYLALTEGRGSGEARIVIAQADTGQVTFAGGPHRIDFPPDPLLVQGVIFRLAACSFPGPGLYWVEFRYDGKTIAREPLQVR